MDPRIITIVEEAHAFISERYLTFLTAAGLKDTTEIHHMFLSNARVAAVEFTIYAPAEAYLLALIDEDLENLRRQLVDECIIEFQKV